MSSLAQAFPGGEPGFGGGGGGSNDPPPPINGIFVPTTNGTGAYNVTWSGGIAFKKELQRSTNGGSYGAAVTLNEGISIWAESGRADGTYVYRVRTCMDPETGSTLCSSYVYSSVVTVVHLPGTPTSLTVPTTDTNGAYSLSFGAASGSVEDYEIEESINGGSFNNVSTGPALSKSLSGRVDGDYTYRVRACNASGCGSFRNGNTTLAVRLTPSVPGTPNAPSNSAGNNSVAITWTKPAGTVTSYDVQKRLGSGSWTTAASGVTGTSRTITSLADGSWTFRVRACNNIWSCSSYGASDTSIVRYRPGTPGAINPTTTTDTNNVTVAWNSVTRATYYNIQRRNNTGSWTTAASSVTGVTKSLSGFSDGSWDFRIQACNTYSWACSSYGVDGSSVTYRIKPSIPAAPTGPSTSTGSSAVSWVKPSGTVTYYDVQKRNNAGSWVTAKAGDTNTSETLSGLTDGSWDYRVHACNGYSWACSNYSADSANTTVRLIPSIPASASPTAPTDTNAVTVSWTAVSGATYYNIQKRNNSGSWASVSGNFTGTSGSVGSLSDGSWDFRIRSCNGYSWACSSYGADGSQVTWRAIPGVPAAPSPTTTTDSNGVTVSWSTVSGATYYNLQKRNNGGSWVGVSGNFTSGSGSAGTLADGSWDFRVRSCNGYSWACSAYSFDGGSVTTRTPPATPGSANPTTTTDTNGVSVSWSAVTNATFYNVQKRVNGGSWTSISANFTGTTGSVGTLTDGSWDFRVKACNEFSWACSSYGIDGSSVLTRLIPATPGSASPTTSTDTNAVTVSWSAVTNGTYYNIQKRVNSGSWTTVSGSFTGASGSVGSLTDGSWDFRVRACNSYSWACSGYGADGTAVVTRTVPVSPAAPSSPISSTGLAALSWSSVTNATYYDIQKRNNSGSWVTAKTGDTNTSETLGGLTDGSWDYRLRACNGYSWACSGYGVDSAQTVVRVPPATPSINTPTVANINDVTVTWPATSGATYYNIEKRVNGGSWSAISGDLTSTSSTFASSTDGSWDYRIRACKDFSWACSSYGADSVNVSVVNLPSTPGAITAPTSSEGAYTISWGTSTGQITSYKLEEKKGSGSYSEIYSGTSSSYNINQSDSDSYYYRVKACNSSGCSAYQTNTQAVVVIVVEDWAKKSTVVNIPNKPLLLPSIPAHEITIGRVPGSASVSGGTASYQIPISLPPGRANMAPGVGVSYSSKSGNGSMGMGWGLSVGSSVSRCPRIVALDVKRRNVQLDNQDRLCLDGQFLILMSGTYGSSGAEYRTELNNFARVTQSGDMSSNSSSFKVELKGGRINHYGTSLQSTFVASGVTVPSSWAIEMEEDRTPARNNIRYKYTDFTNGEYLLTKINYTGSYGVDGDRTVEFNYSSGVRSDPSNRYLAGGLTRQTKLLENIKTYAKGSQIFVYNFTYQLSPASNRSLLQSVQQCDALTNCLPSTTFEWNDAAVSFVLEELQYNNGSSQVIIEPNATYISRSIPQGDVNADGVRDWPGVFVNAEGEETEPNNQDPLQTCFLDPFSFQYTCLSSDFNQDGLTDNWKVENNTLKMRYTVDGATGTWFDTPVPILGQFSKLKDINDYNGDGWPDLVVFEFTGNCAKLYLHTNTQNPNQPYTLARQALYAYSCATARFNPDGNQLVISGEEYLQTSVQFMGDMDGNGLPDLMVSDLIYQYLSNTLQHAQPVPKTLLFSQYSGNQFSFNSLDLTDYIDMDREIPNYFNFFMDVNGDGMQDWLSWSGDSLNSNQQISLALNNGGDFEDWQGLGAGSLLAFRQYTQVISTEIQLIKTPKYSSSFRQMDYNNDGRAELLVPGERVITACADIWRFEYFGGPAVNSPLCGDDLYGNILTNDEQQLVDATPINSGLYDESIYQFDAIFFEEQSNGSYQAVRKPTGLFGSATQTTSIDAFGNGLTDFIFTYNCRNTDVCSFHETPTVSSPMDNIATGLIINKSVGSSTGATPYEAPDMLAKVTDGFGNHSEWSYRPLSSDLSNYSLGRDFYEMDKSGLNPGYFHFASSMYVVAEFKQSDGIDGLIIQQYSYGAAVYNNEGRGFQGFREITEDNLNTGIRNHVKFDQFFPKSGNVEIIKTCLLGDSKDCEFPISEKTFTYLTESQSSLENNMIHWTYPSTDSFNNYDPETRLYLFGAINTTEQVDEYGNILVKRQIIDSGDSTAETITTINFHPVNLDLWWLNKIKERTVLKKSIANRTNLIVPIELDVDQSVITSFEWSDAYRQPNVIVSTPTDNQNQKVTIEVAGFTEFGQSNSVIKKTNVKFDGNNLLQEREINTIYQDDHYFPKELVNSLGHSTTFSFRAEDGKLNWVIDPNGLKTSIFYDSFNKVIETQNPDKPSNYVRVSSCDVNAPSNCTYMLGHYQEGSVDQIKIFDSNSRIIQSRIRGFDGRQIFTSFSFDNLGRRKFESIPQFDSESNLGVKFLSYDLFGRLEQKQIDTSGGNVLNISYEHQGLTTYIKPLGLGQMSRTYNGLKQLVQTSNSLGGITKFGYDNSGNPIVVENSNGSKILAKYNSSGSKSYVIDPDLGRKDFTYTGFGEIESEVDAEGNVLNYEYDELGRITKRYLNAILNSTWEYDDASSLGAVSSESIADGDFSRIYSYNNKQQLNEIETIISGEIFKTKIYYDSNFGRAKGVSYPNGFALAYEYNSYGYQSKVSNPESNYVYQEQTDMDARGNLTEANLAGGLVSKQVYYDEVSGQMNMTVANHQNGSQPFYIDYDYDNYGNLTKQNVNYRNGIDTYNAFETYVYDDLHRLTSTTVVNSLENKTTNYGYDLLGNLIYKSDYGSVYDYGDITKSVNNAGPNAITKIQRTIDGVWENYTYDNNGNLINNGDGTVINYNSYNKPITINNGVELNFSYGTDIKRYRKVRQNGIENETTLYLAGGKYERITRKNSGIWENTIIRLTIGDSSIISWKDDVNLGMSNRLSYILRDRLGSVMTLLNEQGDVGEFRSYDSFGKPRAGDLTSLSIARLSSINSSLVVRVTRGFTDHEHLDDVDLIHMNGRLYNYNIGRFLSADPIIQDPGNSQSFNPYSYLMNNPLAGTDPSGYFGCAASRLEKACSQLPPSAGGNGDFFKGKNLTASKKLSNGRTVTISIQLARGAEYDPSDLNSLNDRDIESVSISNGESVLFVTNGENGVSSTFVTVGTRTTPIAESPVGNHITCPENSCHPFTNNYMEDALNRLVSDFSSAFNLDNIQTGLAGVGMLPAVGLIADIANAGISLLRGNFGDAVIDLGSAIPFGGQFIAAGSILRRGNNVIKQFDVLPYGQFRKFPGDGLDGHELIQSAWLTLNGFGKRHSKISNMNPAIALDPKLHDKISALQKKLGLKGDTLLNMSVNQNMLINVQILKEVGMSRKHILEITKQSREFSKILK